MGDKRSASAAEEVRGSDTPTGAELDRLGWPGGRGDGEGAVEEALAYLLGGISPRRGGSGSPAGARSGAGAPARARLLLDRLDRPDRKLRIVHVTGTNGKTSTATLVAAMLRSAGLCVGTFTSPHVHQLRERVALDGRPVSDAELARAVLAVRDAELAGGRRGRQDAGDRPRFFEILTAGAMWLFAEKGVDVAVVEVGIGGRTDATNALRGEVAVLTNVGLDHVAQLGPTTRDIAWHKAGIVKRGAHVVLGDLDPSLEAVVLGEAAVAGAREAWRWGRELGALVVAPGTGGGLVRSPLAAAPLETFYPADHRLTNLAVALGAAEALLGEPLGADRLSRALEGAQLPGRLEVVAKDPLVVVDAVKNVLGARAASAALEAGPARGRGRVLVVGLLEGHEPTEILDALGAGTARAVVACEPRSARAVPATEIGEAAAALGAPSLVVPDVGSALEAARSLARVDDVVLVAGSLYVVAAARESLGLGPESSEPTWAAPLPADVAARSSLAAGSLAGSTLP